MTRLNDIYDVTIEGDNREGRVIELRLNGDARDPDSVTVTLNTGVSFTIPWEQY